MVAKRTFEFCQRHRLSKSSLYAIYADFGIYVAIFVAMAKFNSIVNQKCRFFSGETFFDEVYNLINTDTEKTYERAHTHTTYYIKNHQKIQSTSRKTFLEIRRKVLGLLCFFSKKLGVDFFMQLYRLL